MVEYFKSTKSFKKIFERTLQVFHPSEVNVRDIAYNFIDKITSRHSNLTKTSPVGPGNFTLANYKFGSKIIPSIFKKKNMNTTAQADDCFGRKWNKKKRTCFISVMFRLLFVD